MKDTTLSVLLHFTEIEYIVLPRAVGLTTTLRLKVPLCKLSLWKGTKYAFFASAPGRRLVVVVCLVSVLRSWPIRLLQSVSLKSLSIKNVRKPLHTLSNKMLFYV